MDAINPAISHITPPPTPTIAHTRLHVDTSALKPAHTGKQHGKKWAVKKTGGVSFMLAQGTTESTLSAKAAALAKTEAAITKQKLSMVIVLFLSLVDLTLPGKSI